MSYVTFDLEIFDDLILGQSYTGQGISCAALAFEDGPVMRFSNAGTDGRRLDKDQAIRLVQRLSEIEHGGDQIVTWNGTSFDFKVLAIESGEYDVCRRLALNHIDLMLYPLFIKGFPLALDKVLTGMGLKGKTHEVYLKSGEKITNMAGGKAPLLWRQGEYDAVLTYLDGDVTRLLELTKVIAHEGKMEWISGSGKPMYLPVGDIGPVKDLFSIPEPNTSWMTNPVTRDSATGWLNYHKS